MLSINALALELLGVVPRNLMITLALIALAASTALFTASAIRNVFPDPEEPHMTNAHVLLLEERLLLEQRYS